MRMVEVEVHSIVLDQTKSFEQDIQFLAKNETGPYIVSGDSHEIQPLYQTIKASVTPPARLTFWLAPPFLGIGQKKEIFGIKSEKETLLNASIYIVSKQKKYGATCAFLLALSALLFAAIYFDWEWVWQNAD